MAAERGRMKRIVILGATGSIGASAADVVRSHPDDFSVVAVAARSSRDRLEALAREFGAKAYCGEDAAVRAVEESDADVCLVATVGMSGLKPTIAAIEKGMDVALATKEVMVMAGELVTRLAKAKGVRFLPVDSEHSAIFQCLQGSPRDSVASITLTASGGPFLDGPADLSSVTPEQALNHPRWKMGPKVTIDSATMMNKGFEVIEAKWLFDVEPERIHVVVHPESVIHSMVEFADGAVLAQLGCPDMREPIQLALSYPERLSLNNKKLDFGSLGALTFFEPDLDKFPCLKLAFDAIGRGGNIPCALNAANEAAVAGYLQDRFGFYDIASVAAETLACTEFVADPTLDDIFATNEEAFAHARSLIW